MSTTLQNKVQEFSDITEKIDKYADALSRLKAKRDRVTTELQTELSKTTDPGQSIKTKHGVYRFRKTKVYSGFNKEYLCTSITRLLGDPRKADAIVNRLYTDRPVTEKVVLTKMPEPKQKLIK